MDTRFLNRLPKSLYRAAQVRELDRLAIEVFKVPGFELMQRASASALDYLNSRWPETPELLIFCGAGNNAGDGYALAAQATSRGLRCRIVWLVDPQKLSGDAAKARDLAEQAGVPFDPFSSIKTELGTRLATARSQLLLVDALLGTGLDRDLEGEFAEAVALINASPAPVLALDIPSGLQADSGMPMAAAVHAEATVTFIGLKQGLLTGSGRDHVGELIYRDLDLPDALFSHADAPSPAARRIDIHDASGCLPARRQASHKGNFGQVLVVGGDHAYGGAPLMAAEAALRTGAGLVSVATRSVHRTAMLARRPELMVSGSEDDGFSLAGLMERATVCLLGPGLGRGPWGAKLFTSILALAAKTDTALVIDADGLFHLAERAPTMAVHRDWILTPHPGEAATLLDFERDAVSRDRFAALADLHQRYGGAILLKGSGSLLQTEGGVALCSEGNPGMASGGMGDVLGGIIAALRAQGLSAEQALRCGVCLHGEAADVASEQLGQRGLLATDLLPALRRLLNPLDGFNQQPLPDGQ